MKIAFLHTPMATLKVDGRQEFWRNFDMRYHATHPGLRHMRRNLWELPHWMIWLAGVLVDHQLTSLSAIDFYTAECALDGVDEGKVRQALEENPADVYLFSPMTPNLPFALEIADIVKDVYPGSTTIFGGVVATPLYERVASHRSVDYVVIDRGEYALPELLKAIQARQEPSHVKNLAFKTSGGNVVAHKERYPFMPVNEIPFPKVDLFDSSVGQDIRYLRQVYGLGCSYKCSFCTIQTIGRKASYFHIDRVLREIRAYRAHYGEHHNIYFGDETFTLEPQRAVDICAALAAEGDIKYDCQTRLDCLDDPRIFPMLRKSGCLWIELGVETATQEGQDLYKQHTRLDQGLTLLKRFRDEGIATCSFMVNGFPGQTLDQMKQSVDWICRLISDGLLHATYFFGLVPYPGSLMYSHPEKFGMRLRHHDYRYYHEEMEPVFDTEHATAEEIYKVFQGGVKQLGQAMGGRPSLGELPPHLDPRGFGSFWGGLHV
jgi:radical SAM superfamily enzyme YgiQ (UPF0313 family)